MDMSSFPGMHDMSYLYPTLIFFLFLNIQHVQNGFVFLVHSNCCESNKKLKDPFVKVESICLCVPIVDNFQYKKYSYLICLLY